MRAVKCLCGDGRLGRPAERSEAQAAPKRLVSGDVYPRANLEASRANRTTR